jgi:YVTN family beta-propeller protein
MNARFGRLLAIGAALAAFAVPRTAPAQGGPFVNFETIPTRAVTMSPDGQRLFVTNVPDSRLEIFDITPTGLTPAGSVPVGLEPIAVNARTNGEVWVVNHVSDSVSVVDVSSTPPRVIRTLLVGDEPRDVVFAGPNRSRAFITAARRGQNHPADTVNETQVPGLGRADVWVFDANAPGARLGGNPLSILTLFGDKPGSMEVSPDGSRVFVTIFTSGNDTTTINELAICGSTDMAGMGQTSAQGDGPCRLVNRGRGPGGIPGPNRNQVDGAANPRTGTIVKLDRATGAWLDVAGRDWRDAVQSQLADNDMFVIDANATPPREIRSFQGVGTLNFNPLSHPTNGRLYVTTIEAINANRFLSVPRIGAFPNPNPRPGVARTADPLTGKTLRGHVYESRITVVDPASGSVLPRHLNPHIPYEVSPTPPGVKERSVANPQGLVFSPDGATLFVAALGSNKIVPFPTADIDSGNVRPDAATHIQLSGDGGPTDMVIDTTGRRMFVYKRFDNAVAEVDLVARREISVTPLFNPEPPAVRVGRKFFYDATLTSSNGEANCNVCHPAADKDDLAWDLGMPFFGLQPNPNPFVPAPGFFGILFPDPVAFNQFATGLVGGNDPTVEFNPLKGPMTVLTLRGIKDSGPMFWRGDLTNPTDPLNERLNFQEIAIVFEALNGLDAPLPQANLASLTDWALTLVPPPNPHRGLANTLNASQAAGRNVFLNGGTMGATDVIFNCNDCHGLDPGRGFFGTRGEDVIEGETQFFKVTQLRTVYDKVGMFGHNFGDNGDPRTLGGARARLGPQVRGFGTLHDGSAAGAEEFLTADVFQLTAPELRQVVDFSYAFDSNLAPIVGQQVTLRSDSGADVVARANLLRQRAMASFVIPGPRTVRECDLVAQTVRNGTPTGFLFDPATGMFRSDAGETVTEATLRGLAATPGQEVTLTCVYPGGGMRLALDRDLDGRLNNGGMAPGGDQGGMDPAPPVVDDGNRLRRILRALFGRR